MDEFSIPLIALKEFSALSAKSSELATSAHC